MRYALLISFSFFLVLVPQSASSDPLLDQILKLPFGGIFEQPLDEFMDEAEKEFDAYIDKMQKRAHDRAMNPGAHWYDENCCNEEDCRPYETSEYKRVKGGYIVQYGMSSVFLDDQKMRPRPHHANPDNKVHFCIMQTVAEPEPEGRCWYPPTRMF